MRTQHGLRQYPAGADVEVIAALRYALERTGWQPGELAERAGLLPGAVDAILAGQLEPAGPVLRRICEALLIPRWLFHLTGVVVLGADLGHSELELLLEKRRRMLTGNPDQVSDADLVVEAVEILFAIGEGGLSPAPPGTRRAITDGLKRLARRAQSAGQPAIACLVDAIAVLVLLCQEELAITRLKPVLDVVALARLLEAPAETGKPSGAR